MKLTTSLSIALALAVSATPALAEQIVPADKLLPFLDKFLKVPPAERTRVKLSYALRRDGQPLANLKATLVEKGGARTPLPINGEGYFERLPTLAQLQGGADIVLDVPADAKLGKVMSFGTQIKPAAEYEARDLVATVDEANTVIGKAAGPMSFMARGRRHRLRRRPHRAAAGGEGYAVLPPGRFSGRRTGKVDKNAN
jgi:hypothetical protein